MPPAKAEGLVTISFNVMVPGAGLDTKAMGEDPDINSLHLIVFDENGYYIEACEAEFDGYNYHVTLHQADKRRIIHFIANCPVDQIQYGHETTVIGNMYVTKGTDNETAYWHRIVVPYIITDTVGNLDETIKAAFMDVPLLRNFASISVVNLAPDFVLESYAIYNTINIGTVAPFNVSQHSFQSFLAENGSTLSYNTLTNIGYQGHALSEATLNSTLTELDFRDAKLPTYMYERKISVRTDDEQKWHESPAHIILKGKYNNSSSYSYYKVDMVKPVDGTNIYYNILRNFKYTFNIYSVAGKGYSSFQEAMANPAGNNLSGATDTQGYTNISDGIGRIFVSYTDTTLVSSDNISFRYKYIPSIDNYSVTANDRVEVKGIFDGTGSVLKSIVSRNNNVGDGWSEIILETQQAGAITHMQEIQLNVAENPNLNKNVRFRLQKPHTLSVECNPQKVAGVAGSKVTVLIGIPDYLTEDMFPLHLAIEVEDHTLSPDASVEGNDIIVQPGASFVPSKTGKPSYHFIKTIETYEDYKAIPASSGKKYISTHWLTNKAHSSSTAYVYNKYFNLGWDDFVTSKAFTNLAFPNGVMAKKDSETKFVFEMENTDAITVKLEGLRNASGQTEFTYTPSASGQQTLTLYTLNPAGTVSVTLESDNYATETLSQLQVSKFEIATLTVTFNFNVNTNLNANNVTPTLSINSGTISYGSTRTTRSGSRGNYTFTTTYSNVVINNADVSSVVTASYQYNNSNRYSGTATVQTIVNSNNPTITMTKQ